jgi:arylsulfatase A-like enzyme
MKKIFLLLLIFAGISVAFHSIYSFRKYNVILITVDTLRADYLSCYNSAAGKTPNFDRIAKSGVLFTRAHTPISITLPAHASMLTSHYPHELRLFNNGDVFDGSQTMITDVLRKRGYHSSAFVSLGVLKSSFGLGRAFKEYEDKFDKTNGRYYKVASEMNELALPWFEKNKDGRFLAWIHYSDPHEPYITVNAPPDTEIFANGKSVGKYVLGKKETINVNFIAKPGENNLEVVGIVPRGPKKIQIMESMRFVDPEIFSNPPDVTKVEFGPEFQRVKLSTGADAKYFTQRATMKLINNSDQPLSVQLRFSGGVYQQRIDDVRRNYAAEVQYVDKYIGELWDQLDKLGLLKKSIVIITADHGEGLKSHGNLGHVERLYQETIRVPLIIYYPNLGRRGSIADPIVNHMDLMPTVLDLLHVKYTGTMRGLSLKHYISWSPIDWISSAEVKRPATFSATYAPEARVNSFAMVYENMKLIHTPNKSKWQWEAYDLKQDPGERKNLAAKDVDRFNSKEVSLLRGLLEDFRREAEAAHGRRTNPTLDPEQRKMLHDLGYIGGYENQKPFTPESNEKDDDDQ